jgi:hypothetical protein
MSTTNTGRMNDYWQDGEWRIFQFEAGTRGGVYGWFRNVETGESVRLKFSELHPMGAYCAVQS